MDLTVDRLVLEGQHNDSRMNMALIMTAVKHGAVVANYTELTNLQKDASGKINGAEVVDVFSGEKFNLKAKVNAHNVDPAFSFN